MSTEKISIEQARKLVLLSQKLPPVKTNRTAIKATLAAIEQLGYIQIDTISVIERAHHHTIWNRNPRYEASQLDQLIKEKKVFEYWSHAASYLPMRDYRHSLPRKTAIANREQSHWYERNDKLIKAVRKRIMKEGPLMSKDFEDKGGKRKVWESKPAKQALEYLFQQGELMILGRKNFHKVYELTEKVLPENINTKAPTDEEHARFLITRYLEANGLAQANEIVYQLRNKKAIVSVCIKEMLGAKELIEVELEKNKYYALPSSLKLLNKQLDKSSLKILSPFDNLLIQRKRMKVIFDFDYLIECYVPKAKRIYGYFTLPILWNGKLVARVDCKNDRKTGILHIHHLHLEPNLKETDAFVKAFCKELKSFMLFNKCKELELHKTSPTKLKRILQKAIKEIA